ncbi:MAG: four helix bundle protein [bacterium]|jgi:four helix bundle protein
MKQNVIKEKSFNFALEIIKLYKSLVEQKEFIISRQLLKSATSIGANVSEAGAGQSDRDFISKMCIASKEARETLYWLELLDQSEISKSDVSQLKDDSLELIKILTSIVKTSQNNLKTKN